MDLHAGQVDHRRAGEHLAGDRFGALAWDMGGDQVYVIYMQSGESIDLTLVAKSTKCDSGDSSWASRLKIRTGTSSTSCGTAVQCWTASYGAGTTYKTYTATASGWVFVIVDGGSTGLSEDEGYYDLSIQLRNCPGGNCGC